MTRSKKCLRGSLSRVRAESQSSNGRHRKNGCNCGEKNRLYRIQSFLSREYILCRVFRKDGPPLGSEFDQPPANAYGGLTGSDFDNHHCFQDEQSVRKRRKISKHTADSGRLQANKIQAKKHGVGKALMTLWRASNSSNRTVPSGLNYFDRKIHSFLQSPSEKTPKKVSKKQGKSRNKLFKKLPRRKILGNLDNSSSVEPRHSECKLMSVKTQIMHRSNLSTPLIDDEELELMELDEVSSPFRCSHLGSRGGLSCPLCKDVLARFPPKIVKMKQPITAKPWDSTPELVKKLFKVFQFLCNHVTSIEECNFTLDDLAQAFSDEDSLLLGKVHVDLLKLLLLSAEREISTGFIPRSSKDCRFLSFLHFVREREFDVNIWIQSLNSLSWTEILRQVLIATGFGAKYSSVKKNFFSKEKYQLAKYGLHPCTLKGELFQLLLKQGNLGLKVSELVKAPQIATLNFSSETKEVEELIKSTLSSDITLFEKIGPVAYRLRFNHQILDKDRNESDSDDSGSVDDEYSDASTSGSTDDSEVDIPGACNLRIVKYQNRHERTGQKLIESTEIDESYSGKAWVYGLMEGDYSNLSTGEKLDALVALVDLISTCSSLQIVNPDRPASAVTLSAQCLVGSGAKIKRLPSKCNETSNNIREKLGDSMVGRQARRGLSQFGTSQSCSVVPKKSLSFRKAEATEPTAHALKAIHLGSDRRYNNYWLFLGPCNPTDPGHRRIYFESSEDGYWQVIETTQALRDLLLVLDCRGSREAHLFSALEQREAFLCQAMDDFLAAEYSRRQARGSDQSDLDSNSRDDFSPNSDIDNMLVSADSMDSFSPASGVVLKCGNTAKEKKEKFERLEAYDKWIWGSFYSTLNAVKNYRRSYMELLTYCESCHDLYWKDEKHCKVCHLTFEINIDFEERYAIHVATCRGTGNVRDFPKYKVLPSQLQALKAAVYSIEGSMPPGAFSGGWKCSACKVWVKRLRRTSSLPELVQVISDFVSAMNKEWFYENIVSLCSSSLDEVFIYFQTMPKTISALAFWMVKLDRLISPYLEKLQSEKTLRKPQLKGK